MGGKATPCGLGGCIFCVYERKIWDLNNAIVPVPAAVTTIQTSLGRRDVCQLHADQGRWSGQKDQP